MNLLLPPTPVPAEIISFTLIITMILLRSVFLVLKDRYEVFLIDFNSWKCGIFYGIHWGLVMLALSRPGKIQRPDFAIFLEYSQNIPLCCSGILCYLAISNLMSFGSCLLLSQFCYGLLIRFTAWSVSLCLVTQWIALPVSISLISALCYFLLLILECP